MPTLTINLNPDSPHAARLVAKAEAVLAGRASDPGGAADELLHALADEMLACIYEDFQAKSRGDPGLSGIPWAPLDPATVRRKGHARILHDSGRLEESLRPGSGSPDQLLEWGPGWVRVGTKVAYAGYHDAGTRTLPRRPFLLGADEPLPAAWGDRLARVAARVMGQDAWWRKVLLSPG